jgi:16S rRNA (adenine1518-N6/adenine1519-N6)-dimethyltransferase
MNYDSPREIEQTLRNLGIKLKKRWGQNYLINRGLREKIVSILDPRPDEVVWEIGPGLGAMTVLLIERSCSLFLFEIDWKIIQYLESRFTRRSHLRIIAGDVVRTWKDARRQFGLPDRVIGNLPYNSASAIVASFADEGFLPRTMVFTVQRELARRISDPPGSKNYSAFSVLCQSTYRVKLHGEVSPGSFYPRPRVVSSVVELQPKQKSSKSLDRRLFSALIRASFSSRRKTLKNNLLKSPLLADYDRELILRAAQKEEFDLNKRGEVFTPSDYTRLSNRIYRLHRKSREPDDR